MERPLHPFSDRNLPVDSSLVDRYCTGTTSAEDQAVLELLGRHSPDVLASIEELRLTLIRAEMASIPQSEIDLACDAILADERELVRPLRRALFFGKYSLRGGPPVGTRGLRLGFGIAAAVIVFVFHSFGRDRQTLAESYSTRAGQRAMVTLVDGSRLQLQPATKISVTTSTRPARTMVTVIGEVLFNVHPDAHRQFVVQAGFATARVLGTQFLVRRYPDEKVVHVIVADGRVSVQGTSARAVLSSRMLGVVNDSGTVTVVPRVPLENYNAWHPERLVFRRTPVREVVAELSRVFDADIRLADSSLGRQTLTWTVPVTDRTLADVISVLAENLNAQAVKRGRVITIIAGAAKLTHPSRSNSSLLPETQYGR
jgi:transmembrane sensor